MKKPRDIMEICRDILSFDWSGNDSDAARYIDELREAVERYDDPLVRLEDV